MTTQNPVVVEITESITEITVVDSDTISINLSPEVVTVEVNNFALPIQYPPAANVIVVPYGTITSTNLQDALEELADQDFRQSSTPSGINVQEGDTWYDTENNIYKVYREVSIGVFAWTNIVVADENSLLDAGAF